MRGGGGRSLGGGTTVRVLTSAAAMAVHDLRDRDGLARPLLRRGALRLVGSRREPARRLGGAYLRIDPMYRSELTVGAGAAGEPQAPPPAPFALPPGGRSPAAVGDVVDAEVIEVDVAGEEMIEIDGEAAVEGRGEAASNETADNEPD